MYNAANYLLAAGDAASRVSTLKPERNRVGLNRIDLLIIAAYLAGITLFGLRFRKRQRTMRDYFLADRNIPWWAISLSIVAAETSTLTIISIPGLAYDSNLTFLQVVMGYVIGRVIISFVLLPQYFRGELYTAYQLIERRFGPELRTVTAGLFLLTRAAAEGVRVYAVSIVVSIALGTGEIASIAIITLLTLIYTFEGGLAAVIWTDVVQTFIYVGGTLLGLVTILHLVPGGWGSVEAIAGGLHKFQVFDPTTSAHWPNFNFAKPYTLWAGIIGGAFLTTASHGTDQLIVQRLLAARNQRQSVLALLSSGVAVFFQFGLFLFVGVMLFAYYQVPSSAFGRADRIYPTFIVTRMPHCGAVDRGCFGGGNVELERGAELACVEFGYGFLSSLPFWQSFSFRPEGWRGGAAVAGATGDRRVGVGVVRAGGTGTPSGRARSGSRAANRVGCLRGITRSISAGSVDQARESAGGDAWHDLRIGDGVVFVGMVAGGFHLVGCDRDLRDLWNRLRVQLGVFTRVGTLNHRGHGGHRGA